MQHHIFLPLVKILNDDGREGTRSYAVGGLITNPCVKISWSLTAGARQPDDFITTGHQYLFPQNCFLTVFFNLTAGFMVAH